MPGNLVFSLFAIIHLCIALGAFTLIAVLPAAAVCLFMVELITAFDNAATVMGRYFGLGKSAERLSLLRFFLHATLIALLVPVYIGIGEVMVFGIPAMVSANVVGWSLALLIALLGYFVQYRRMGPLMPVNFYGCLRYAQSVSDATRYSGYAYTDAELAARGKLPLASVLTTLTGLVLALFIGWFGGFWLPFVVTVIMFAAAAFPQRGWGPLLTSCLEIVFSLGLLFSLAEAVKQAA